MTGADKCKFCTQGTSYVNRTVACEVCDKGKFQKHDDVLAPTCMVSHSVLFYSKVDLHKRQKDTILLTSSSSSSSSSFSSSSPISSRIALLDGSTQTKKLLLLTTKLAIGARSLCPSAVLELSIVLGAPLDGSKTMTEQRHALRVFQARKATAKVHCVPIAVLVLTNQIMALPFVSHVYRACTAINPCP